MSTTLRIKGCLDNYEKYVVLLASLPDKELARKLNLVHLQSEIAERTKNTSSLELLEIWRAQIIEARILKAENNIPDTPNEIELAIADVETVVSKTEKRKKILKDFNNPVKESHPKVQEQDNDNQLSLF